MNPKTEKHESDVESTTESRTEYKIEYRPESTTVSKIVSKIETRLESEIAYKPEAETGHALPESGSHVAENHVPPVTAELTVGPAPAPASPRQGH
jgi:hypothetical protein